MKKFFFITLALSIFFVFAGCNKKSDQNTIEFWTLQLSPVFDEYFHSLIKEYEAAHKGIKIKWVDVPYDAVIQKLLASMAAGNPPDVVNLSTDFLAKFAGLNALEEISNFIDTDSLNKIYLPNAIESCTFRNKIVALPWYLNTYALIYNKKLLKESGFLESEVPKTYTELVNFIKEYKRRTGNFALFWNIGKDSYLPMMLGSEGIPMVNDNLTKALFNSKEASSLISMWIDLFRQGDLPSESLIKTGASIIEPYQSGKVALVFTGPVFLKRIKDNSPEVYSETGIAPPVVGVSGEHELAAMSVAVMKKSLKKKIAVDFALFVTNNFNQLAFCRLATIYPSTKLGLKDKYFVEGDSSLESKARIMGAELLPKAKRLRRYLQHPKFDLLRDIFDETIQSIALGGVPLQKGLDNAVQNWNTILSGK